MRLVIEKRLVIHLAGKMKFDMKVISQSDFAANHRCHFVVGSILLHKPSIGANGRLSYLKRELGSGHRTEKSRA